MTEHKASYTAGVMANLKMPLARTFLEAASLACKDCEGTELLYSGTPGLLGSFPDKRLKSAKFSVDFSFPKAELRIAFMTEMSRRAGQISQEDGVVMVVAGNVLANAPLVEALVSDVSEGRMETAYVSSVVARGDNFLRPRT